ncbi:helix-turn-helix domain-containing protein [Rhizobium halophytocola]|uniref:AraC-like DNA-binding protein n=1 Tax=Rhizobium halophytocola TaxID=735519 RepID=A0ABS4DTM8_9HYPH|nr:AraC family transcriptional regulator [Rhizobium halophytocola]MBP1849035.1 AraC-like DNA-binding protein [Rhizobium halophytocola]
MRPYLEKLPPISDASWSMLNRRLDDGIPFQWHHHPEYELTLTLNSIGQRFIGDHVGEYGHGDLVLVGPNLPHTWSSRERIDAGGPHVALVFWFRQDWIDGFLGNAVELSPIRQLFAEAAPGLSFGPEIGESLRSRFEAMFSRPPRARLMAVLDLLAELAEQRERGRAQPLASGLPPPTTESRSRIDRVLNALHRDYAGTVRMGDLADLAALSQSGLHRMFSKHTHSTISAYLTRLRVGDACARLSGTTQPIAHIAAETGYRSLANFNRQFRSQTGMTPSAYRASFRT